MKQDHLPFGAPGISRPQIWLGIAMLAVVLGLILMGTRSSSSDVYSADARPRLVAARGRLDLGEQVAVRVFRAASPSVVFITSEEVRGGLFRMQPLEVEKNAGSGFAIPIDTVNRIVPRIIRGQDVSSPSLGITPAPDHLVRRLGLDGVLILAISPNTPAEEAGLQGTERSEQGRLRLGDLITAIDGKPVHTTDDLYGIIDEHKAGDEVQLTIVREGRKMDVEVKLEPRS